MRHRIEIVSELCNGCRICVMACSLRKSGRYDQFHTGIWIESDDSTGENLPLVCAQCAKPLCVKVCPAEGSWQGEGPFDPPIYQDPATRITWLDTRKESCLGCFECMKGCPFGSIRVVPGGLQLVKCDLCGGDPECVKACPTGAIRFVDVTKIPEKKLARARKKSS